jgi:subtilase family serine protease
MRKRPRRGFRPLWEHLDCRCLPSGFTPDQIKAAYGLNAITFTPASGPVVSGDGTGQTIALIEEYSDPNIQAALDVFDAKYNLPHITLDVINQAGTQTDSGWASEESMDVEWSHAIAPGAAIAVIEVSPGSKPADEFNNLMAAVQSAAAMPGVTTVSMSWGNDEFSDEASDDSNFAASGVTFIASSGDYGSISWPSVSPNVLAVGGTSLTLNSSGAYGSERGWLDSGGGVSMTEGEPGYQSSVQSTGHRSTPDIAFDADPSTGVAVYDMPPGAGAQGRWGDFGGTSLGAPAWAGILAIVNQGRNVAGRASLTGGTETLPALYSLPAADFHKVPITAGGSTGGGINTPGYNTQAGLGSPVGALLVDALVKYSSTSSPTPTPTPSPTPTPTPTPTTPAPPKPFPPLPGPTPTPTPPARPVPVPGPPPTLGTPPAPAPTPPPAPPPVPAPGHKPRTHAPKHHARGGHSVSPIKPIRQKHHAAKPPKDRIGPG